MTPDKATGAAIVTTSKSHPGGGVNLNPAVEIASEGGSPAASWMHRLRPVIRFDRDPIAWIIVVPGRCTGGSGRILAGFVGTVWVKRARPASLTANRNW